MIIYLAGGGIWESETGMDKDGTNKMHLHRGIDI